MHEFEPKFEAYLEHILSSLKIDNQEKRQLKIEWNQHLIDSLNNLTKNGIPKEAAVEIAIEQFGTPELMKQEVTHIYLATRSQQRLKELVIWIICLIAASIGPYLLIKAHFSMSFIVISALALLFYYFVYHRVVRIIPNIITYIAILPIYVFWVYLFLQLGNEVSLGQYINNLFTLDWSKLTGVDGLFQFPTLHMFWYTIVLVNILLPRDKSLLKQIVVASFQYWTMLAIGLALANIVTNSEASVIILNVALLYAFLQQIVYTIKFKGLSSMAIS